MYNVRKIAFKLIRCMRWDPKRDISYLINEELRKRGKLEGASCVLQLVGGTVGLIVKWIGSDPFNRALPIACTIWNSSNGLGLIVYLHAGKAIRTVKGIPNTRYKGLYLIARIGFEFSFGIIDRWSTQDVLPSRWSVAVVSLSARYIPLC